jgi:hypothetical protein
MEVNWSHLLKLLLLLLSPGVIAAGVADTLGKAGNITGDETLVSANGTFTMGFFSLGPSTNKRYYLGIWFSVSSDAVCWVANSERPLPDKTGSLVLSDTGSLQLRDDSGQVAWSSNSTIASSSSVEAQLLETGNLVVRDQGSSNVLLWQSFDHPSNTLLSGMKVGKNLWSGAEWHLTSWRSADDPSPGPYRRVLDTSGLPDFVLRDGNATIYRSGPWNGRLFSGATEVLGNTYTDLQITMSVTISPGEISYSYTSKPGAALTRLVVTDDGKVNRVVWDKSSRGWTQIFQGPRDPCDVYGKCGSFGLCDVSSVLSFCSCLRGFSPASPSAWSRDTSGCRRNVELQCSNGGTTDGFVLVKGVKLPETHNASVDMLGITTMKECRRRCRANCSCLAYAAADIRGGGVPSGCVMWTDSIVDLRYVDHGQDLYLRLAKSELGVLLLISAFLPHSKI